MEIKHLLSTVLFVSSEDNGYMLQVGGFTDGVAGEKSNVI